MITVHRTNSTNPDFINLVALLDAELAERDGAEHAFYNQFNSITSLKTTILLIKDKTAIGCGAIKPFDKSSMEVKRMYIIKTERGKGYATQILKELEKWAFELRYENCVLETGKRQPEAIALYEKNGYQKIANYGQYQGIENSVCFQKNVSY
jgi:GNAT superfamily N-acetyltransferase